jgi:hypothetical protein
MMRRFTSLLIVSPLSDGNSWVLREPLVYQPNGHAISVPAGFVTDFASIPRPLWALLPKWGRHGNAAVVHDWLYWSHETDRATADRTFREAMEILGVLWGVRWAMWAAVRSFGWMAWWGNTRDRDRGFNRVLSVLPTATDSVAPRGIEHLFRSLFGMRDAA